MSKRPGVNTKNKRNPVQRQLDRTRIAELVYEHPDWDDAKLAEGLAQETGVALSRQQINSDRRKMMADYAEREHDAIALAKEAALAKLDNLEEMAYEGWKRSLKPNQTERARKLAGKKKDGEYGGDGMYLAELETLTTEGVGDPRFLTAMLDIQKERNKINQVYPNPKVEVQQTNVIQVKTIANFDPKQWEKPTREIVDAEEYHLSTP